MISIFNKYIAAFLGFATLLFGHAAYAAGSGLYTFRDLVNKVGNYIIKAVVPILFGIAVLSFIWNLTQYLTKLDNESEREKFKKYSVNSILALFIMVALWGIISIATRSLFGVGVFIPQLPVQ